MENIMENKKSTGWTHKGLGLPAPAGGTTFSEWVPIVPNIDAAGVEHGCVCTMDCCDRPKEEVRVNCVCCKCQASKCACDLWLSCNGCGRNCWCEG